MLKVTLCRRVGEDYASSETLFKKVSQINV